MDRTENAPSGLELKDIVVEKTPDLNAHKTAIFYRTKFIAVITGPKPHIPHTETPINDNEDPLQKKETAFGTACLLLVQKGRHRTVLRMLEEVLEESGETAGILFRIAQCHEGLKNYKKALKFYEKCISKDIRGPLGENFLPDVKIAIARIKQPILAKFSPLTPKL